MKNRKRKYIVAGCKPWSKEVFNKKISKYPGEWHFISIEEDLNEKKINKINPEYIFFLHWSFKVSEDIIKNYNCVCFHMTDVPYGRGGSPLQNLIIRGYKKTKLTALKMTESFDAGPVYLKRPLSLIGRAEEIYLKANYLASKMILDIINKKIIPKKQKGKLYVILHLAGVSEDAAQL